MEVWKDGTTRARMQEKHDIALEEDSLGAQGRLEITQKSTVTYSQGLLPCMETPKQSTAKA